MLTERIKYERTNLIESDSEGSDTTDGDDTDFINGDADIRIDPEMASKITSYNISRLNNEVKTRFNLKQKMYRVIPIKANEKVMQIKSSTSH